MKKTRKQWVIILFFLIVVACTNLVYAAGATLSKSAASIIQGKTFKVTVYFSNYVCAANYNMKYDTSRLTLISGDTSIAWVEGETKPTYTFKAKAGVAGTANISITGTVSDTDFNKTSLSSSTTVKITAPVTISTKPKLTVTKSTNAKLSLLKVNIEGINPDFNTNKYSYALSVGTDISKLIITVRCEDSGATYYITGNKDFKEGDNIVRVVVTAEDRKTTKTYKIVVTKSEEAETSNAYLENLIISNATLKTKFQRNTLEYTLKDIASDITKLDIRAFPEDKKALVKIDGNEALVEGLNKIKIIVTAQDKKTTKTYTLNVNKEATILEPEETNNYNNVNPYIEVPAIISDEGFWDNYGDKIKANASIILLYLLALVEFAQVIYLYRQLKLANPDCDKIIVKRRPGASKKYKQRTDDKDNLEDIDEKEKNK